MSNRPWAAARAIQYAMPTAGQYPDPVPDWVVDAGRAALLVHDMQQYFVERFQPEREPAVSLLLNVSEIVAVCRKLDIPIVYTAQPGRMSTEERGLLRDFWGPGMESTSEQRSILAAVAPLSKDIVLSKWRYSAFVRTSLAQVLENAGRSQLIICGVYAHVGILATAVESYSRDIETFVLADAVADFDQELHLKSLDYMARICARVLPTAQARLELEGTNASGTRI